MPHRRFYEFQMVWGERVQLADGAAQQFLQANRNDIREVTVRQEYYGDVPARLGRFGGGGGAYAPNFQYHYAPEPNPVVIEQADWGHEYIREAYYAPPDMNWYGLGRVGAFAPVYRARPDPAISAQSLQRSKELLESHLTDEQMEQYQKDGTFVVTGSFSPLRQYRITTKTTNPSHNIWRLDQAGKKVRSYCLHLSYSPAGVPAEGSFPLYDHFLAQAVMITTDEPRFLSTAYSGYVGVEAAPAQEIAVTYDVNPGPVFMPPAGPFHLNLGGF